MPPTDNALAAMTTSHIEAVGAHLLWIHGLTDDAQLGCLRDIESLVRYLVDHPERLAGEGQVIVDKAEIEAWKRAYERDTEFPPHDTAYGMICRWLIQENPE